MARRLSALVLLVLGCKNPSRLDAADSRIVVDGKMSDRAWNERSERHVFTADGAQARPWSEIRLLVDRTSVYVALYAADEDIRATDAFELAIGPHRYHLTADGKGDARTLRAGIDADGSIDQPGDDDEEWIVELAVPRAGLPATAVPIEASRCDTPKDGRQRCGSWSGTLALPSR
jgi:hypothetical protein